MKKFLSSLSAFAILLMPMSPALAQANIPAGCETPGDCAALSPTLQEATLEADLNLLDDDGSNFIGLKAPATVGSDITFTLPGADGTNGQMLVTDAAGNLSWASSSAASMTGLSDTDTAGAAAGALLYFDGSDWIDLGLGTAGQMLSTNAGATAPEWTSASVGSFSGLSDTDTTGAAGGALMYFDGTDWIDLGAGTAGQMLTMNAGATAPEWTSASAASLAGLSDVNTAAATTGNLLLADGTDFESVALSGDVTVIADGTTTIGDDTVDGTDIELTGEAAGSLAYSDGTDWVNLGVGSAGQILSTNTGATAPEWIDIEAGEINLSRSETGLGLGSTDHVRYTFTPQLSGTYTSTVTLAAPGGTVDYEVGTTFDGADIYTVNLGSGTPSAVTDVTTFTLAAGTEYHITFDIGSGVAFDDVDTDIEFTVGGGSADFEGLDDTDVTGAAAGALNYFDGTDWIDLGVGTAGQSLAVNAAGDAPEWVSGSATQDMEVLVGEISPASASTNNVAAGNEVQALLLNGATWNDLNANTDYEKYKVVMDVGDGGNWYGTGTHELLRADQFAADQRLIYNTSDGTNWHNQIRVGALNTGDIDFTGSDVDWDGGRVRIYGVRAQKTIINPTDVAVDNTGVTDGNVLVWNDTNSQYEPSAAGGGTFTSLTDTDVTGAAAGALNYFDGTDWIDLGVGTAGQKLAVNTAGDAPEWVTDSTTSTDLIYFSFVPNKINADTDHNGSPTAHGGGTIEWTTSTGDMNLFDPNAIINADTISLDLPEGRYESIMTFRAARTGTQALVEMGVFLDDVKLIHGDAPVAAAASPRTISSTTVPLIFDVPSGGGVVQVRKLAASDEDIENFAFTLKQLPTTAGVGVGGGSAADLDGLTDTDITGAAAGATMYFDGTDWVDIGIGTAGQALVVNTAGDAPEWASASSTPLERGSTRLAANHDITSTGGSGTFEDIGVSVTLPKAGTYELKAMIAAGQIGDDQYINGVITDASGAAVSEFIPVIGTLDQSGVENFFSQGTATIIAEVTTTTDNEVFKIRVAQNNNTALGEINAGTTLFFDQKPTSTVVPAGATAVNDQATSGYIDIGDMRMAWGTTPGSSGIETVTFPAGGFAAAPVVTFNPVGTTIRENSINSVNATQTVIEAGGSQVKHWQATGLKP